MGVAALAGGIGAAKFIAGLVEIIPADELTIIVNTGDDFRWMGLYVCPDLDTVTYSLAGLSNPETGWGVRSDSFRCLERLRALGTDQWFQIGDLDLATHLYRTERLNSGVSLSEVTGMICRQNGIRCRILPATDSPVPTLLHTSEGILEFQDYFVRRKCRPRVEALSFKGIEQASPAPGVLDSLRAAETTIICPSNPFISIGPILAVPGLRNAVRDSSATVVAVTPMIGCRAVKGPTAAMLSQLGHEVSAAGVASLYSDILDVFVLDNSDQIQRERIEKMGLSVRMAETLMDSSAASVELARTALGMAP